MTAANLDLAWQPGPGRRWFRAGDQVRVQGRTGARYTVRGFRLEGGQVVAELYGGKRGRAQGLATVRAGLLRRS